MSWFRRSPALEDRAITRASLPGVMLPTPGSGEPIAPEAALRIADVFACVRCLADTAASLPLVPYVRLADGERERFTGRLSDLIARPAPSMTAANLVGTVVAHLNLHGNAYVGKYRDDRGTVVQLAPLAPQSVSVELVAGAPRYTLLRPGGVSTHGAEDVLHIRALSTDGLLGLSPIRQAAQALGLARSLAGHADTFARNAARPSGIVAVKRPLTPAQRVSLKAEVARNHTGDQVGRTMILDGDLDYHALALTMVDAEFVAQRHLSTAEIARVFRVPPWMVGAQSGDSLTYATVEGQAQAFVTFSLAPWLTLIEQAISADTDLSPRGVFAEFLLDGLLRADARTRADTFTAALHPQTGWMTRAEVRRLENLPPESGAAPPVPEAQEATP